MAIDPLNFVAPPAGSRFGTAVRNTTLRRKDFLRSSRNILDTPAILNRQINATINNVTRRIPGRITQAANNIAINAVTEAAFGAFKGFSENGIQGLITGGVSAGFGGAVEGTIGSIQQISGTVASDIERGINGITNNIGGGALGPLGDGLIGGMKNLLGMSTNVATNGIAGIADSIANLFGGDENANPEGVETFPIDIEGEIVGEDVLAILGVDPNILAQGAAITLEAELRAQEEAVRLAELVNTGSLTNTDISKSLALFKSVLDEIEKAKLKRNSIEFAATSQNAHVNKAVGLLPYQPKYKFLFMVEFVFTPAYENLLSRDQHQKFQYVVKNSNRPTVAFEHEDINMYNFRTKVAKRTMFNDMTMRFYDDIGNNANEFYTQYMRAVSPITNVMAGKGNAKAPIQYQHTSINTEKNKTVHGNNGNGVLSNQGGGSIGSLSLESVTVIQQIILYHVYDWGKLMNVYTMNNPKITQLTLDDVDMAESGAGNEVEIQFTYDGLHVEPRQEVTENIMKRITGDDFSPEHSIVPVFGSEGNDANGSTPGNTDQSNEAGSIFAALARQNNITAFDEQPAAQRIESQAIPNNLANSNIA